MISSKYLGQKYKYTLINTKDQNKEIWPINKFIWSTFELQIIFQQ